MTDAIITKLQQVTEGLLFMSESESPLVPFCWKSDGQPLTPAKLLQLAGHPADAPVQAVNVDEFFATAIASEDWHDEEERATVHRFRQLLETLKQNLKQIQVWKVGARSIDAYIVGVTPAGDWAGLMVQVVET
ncbi:MAG: nuclease A inhibitor family protein [Actinomycetota bacterium]